MFPIKRCVIVCAGEFTPLLAPVEETDLVIAADGGLRHLQQMSLCPHVILGDFDSLGYIPEGAEVHPVEKDDTDTMLAIKKGLDAGCDTFLLYCGLEGRRVDHTMANFQALQYLSQRGARGYLIGKEQMVTTITDGTLTFPQGCSGYLSVFAMGSDAQCVTIRGAQYELENAPLTSGYPLGVSNQFVGEPVTIAVKNGTLLLIWDRENGFDIHKEGTP